MNRITTVAVACLIAICSTNSRADETTAKEAQRLEGVWASKPPEKGRGRGHVWYIQGGKLAWKSFQTRDGEPVIGHSKLYEFAVDPKTTPKRITLTLGKGEDKETQLGVYELDGDTLKIALASDDKKAPKSVTDDDAQTLVLTRDKKAKVPKLEQPEGEEVRINPTALWQGELRDAEMQKKCPSEPITTQAEFEKLWKLLRADERPPKVDFSKEFVLVKTSAGQLKVTKLALVLDPSGKVDTLISINSDAKADDLSYVIAVFQRDVIDAVDGKLVPKKRR